ncbi:hypothetical protein CTEN210_04329 [Chaetoceros tenuissimus]|uniref:MYND-type domain-containing protein n=1 Tax=Chaetoceros tenuissimus TaxID=426638 RepID=A0AAD3H2N1_9STRA|nr:hypothetical protein CTEN210_04329 [Chaetoceros tenuissimus]
MGKKSKRRTGKQERRSHQKKAGAGGRVEDVSQQGASAEDVRVRVMPRRKKKDPNAPKRACSAYLYYASAMRPVVEQEFPDFLSFGEKQKKIAEKFKALTDYERAQYDDMAAKDRERYEREMEKYTPPSDDSDNDSDYDSDVPPGNLKEKEVVKVKAVASPKDHAPQETLLQQIMDESDPLGINQMLDEILEDFTMWSLSDKADLTPKNFEKMAPHTAKMVISEDFSIELIMGLREKFINDLDLGLKFFQLSKGTEILIEEVNFGSEEDEDAFGREMVEMGIEKRKVCFDPPINIYESFQEVAEKWKESRKACFDECRFYEMPVSEFRSIFENMMLKFVSDEDMMLKFAKDLDMSEYQDGKLFRKFFSHPSTRTQEAKDELEKLLVSLLTLYREMNTCWECKKLGIWLWGNPPICGSCKCATYCSRECQVKHWREGKHKECCESLCLKWSSFQRRKKRVGRALYKDRVYTKPIKVNGIEKECFLHPCESIDYYLCTYACDKHNENDPSSMDVFYENLAKLACGGKHLLFGNETISSKLEEKIRTSYDDVISEFDIKSLVKGELDAMMSSLENLVHTETALTEDELKEISKELSVDRFITLYICFEPLNLGDQMCNKFEIEADLLKKVKSQHDKMKLRMK